MVLMSEHFDMGLAVQAGVVIPKKSGGYYDRFRGRIIFPILDLRNQVVGFGARVINDALPKYVNTPETPIFHKGEFLYGLHASYQKIREKGKVLIVEGYMDWLALRNFDVDYAVATLGTALTAHHVRKLRGYTKEAVVVFDSDEAGKMAALRSLPLFINEGLSARVVVLPDGHDPDTFLNENGTDAFLALVDKAVSMLDFYLEMEVAGKDSDGDIVRILKEFLPVLNALNNDALRSIYVRRLSEKVGIRESSVWSELRKAMKNPSARGPGGKPDQGVSLSRAEKITDLQLLNLLVFYPESVSKLVDTECRVLVSDPSIREIIDTIFEIYVRAGEYTADDLLNSLDSEAAREKLREILHRPFAVYSGAEVRQAVAEFERKAHQKVFVDSLKRARGNAEAMNDLIKSKFSDPDLP
jgi:DNA primase